MVFYNQKNIKKIQANSFFLNPQTNKVWVISGWDGLNFTILRSINNFFSIKHMLLLQSSKLDGVAPC